MFGDCEGPFLCLLGDAAIINTGSISAGQVGILAITFANTGLHPYAAIGDGGSIYVLNQGTVSGNFAGTAATVAGNNSTLSIVNEGTVNGGATGIFAATGIETFIPCGCYYGPPIFNPSGYGNNSPISIVNSGTIDPDVGVLALTLGENSPITIQNSGKIEATFLGIGAITYGAASSITIANSGTVVTSGGGGSVPFPIGGYGAYSVAIGAGTFGVSSNVIINNSGTVKGLGARGIGIGTLAYNGGTEITNSGTVYGSYAAILAASHGGVTTIINSGVISAGHEFRHRRLWRSGRDLQLGSHHGFRHARVLRRYLHQPEGRRVRDEARERFRARQRSVS
jgi:hypothetical protein